MSVEFEGGTPNTYPSTSRVLPKLFEFHEMGCQEAKKEQ